MKARVQYLSPVWHRLTIYKKILPSILAKAAQRINIGKIETGPGRADMPAVKTAIPNANSKGDLEVIEFHIKANPATPRIKPSVSDAVSDRNSSAKYASIHSAIKLATNP